MTDAEDPQADRDALLAELRAELLSELRAEVHTAVRDALSASAQPAPTDKPSAQSGADTGASEESSAADAFWALDGLRQRTGAEGGVLFTGTVVPPGHTSPVEWQYARTASDLLEHDWASLAPRIAALSNATRLTILQAVMAGTSTVAELAAMSQFGTSGQIYHHIGALTAAGWLETAARGHYRVPPERIVPLLTVFSACR